jgi:dipeptidase E
MKKIVLHSKQIEGNTEVDEAFLELLSTDKPKIGYIPSCSDLDRKYFKEQKDWYKRFGIDDLFYFDLDKEFDQSKTKELLSCDAIFLSGGDTIYFLKNIQAHGFVKILRQYVEDGGILIGVSAGSVLMTSNIEISTLDHNHDTKKLEDMSALDLVGFEFYPHLNRNRDIFLDEIKQYSKKSKSVIYACEDGAGIIVDGNKTHFYGNIVKIKNGKISEVK